MSDTKDLAIIILAAGKGSRMKSPLAKVMHPLAGQPMISWLLGSCVTLNPAKVIVVIGPDMDYVRTHVQSNTQIDGQQPECVVQQQQNGTADALKAAMPALGDFNGRVLVLMGDEPFVPISALQQMVAQNGVSALAFQTANPHGLGRMVMDDDGALAEIVEEKDCSDAQRQITLCNAGNYALPGDKLAGWLAAIGNDNAQGEYYLTDLPKIAAKDGVKTYLTTIPWDGPWGVNDKAQLAVHEGMIQKALRLEALKNGVTMISPDSVYFHYDTQIAAGVVIEPDVFFGAAVRVDEGAHIKAFSHIEGAHIKVCAQVGPFARLRPGSEIGEKAKIGNFAEINRSTIGDGSKISHHSYVGDTEMGAGVNFSAGAITANYDGFNKSKTLIGDNAMIGTNVNLIAPLSIGKDAYIAAGSTVSADVPDGALALGRADSKIKEGWVARFRKMKDARSSK